jgi:hypothetical protein
VRPPFSGPECYVAQDSARTQQDRPAPATSATNKPSKAPDEILQLPGHSIL